MASHKVIQAIHMKSVRLIKKSLVNVLFIGNSETMDIHIMHINNPMNRFIRLYDPFI